ncbi:MAG: signal transduction histidine kinase [Clostridium sp.]|jgi:signal transduction histidine kinase
MIWPLAKWCYELNIDITETSICVLGNQESLERIMNNLIYNSIRYGSDGKFIGLNLSCHDKLGGEIILNSKPYEKTSFTFKLKRINY